MENSQKNGKLAINPNLLGTITHVFLTTILSDRITISIFPMRKPRFTELISFGGWVQRQLCPQVRDVAMSLPPWGVRPPHRAHSSLAHTKAAEFASSARIHDAWGADRRVRDTVGRDLRLPWWSVGSVTETETDGTNRSEGVEFQRDTDTARLSQPR